MTERKNRNDHLEGAFHMTSPASSDSCKLSENSFEIVDFSETILSKKRSPLNCKCVFNGKYINKKHCHS
jgi:hypothetical protein